MFLFATLARGVEVTECSANDESCVAEDGIDPAEKLTECEDTSTSCQYWASLGEVSGVL